VLDDYLKHVLSFIDTSVIKPFKFVGNAISATYAFRLPPLVKKLGLDLIPLNFVPDGTFPKGPPDPMLLRIALKPRD